MLDTIYQALDQARQNFPPIVKGRTARMLTKTGKEYTYTYADLASVLEAVEGPLREQDLIIVQQVVEDRVETSLVHAGVTRLLLASFSIAGITDPQKVGSAVTYYRRYGLVTGLGLVTEDDDDGEAATGQATGVQDTPKNGRAVHNPAGGRATKPSRSGGDEPSGWGSPAARAAAHDQLLHRLNTLTEEQKAGLREQVEGMGGMPLSADNFRLVNVAVDLFDGQGIIETGGGNA